jgi:hypothetical protein
LNLFNRWFYETSNQPRKVLWLSTSWLSSPCVNSCALVVVGHSRVCHLIVSLKRLTLVSRERTRNKGPQKRIRFLSRYAQPVLEPPPGKSIAENDALTPLFVIPMWHRWNELLHGVYAPISVHLIKQRNSTPWSSHPERKRVAKTKGGLWRTENRDEENH